MLNTDHSPAKMIREIGRHDHSLIPPCLSEFIAGKRAGAVTRTWIGLHAGLGYRPPNLAPEPPQLGLQCIQLGTGNADHLRCFEAHGCFLPTGIDTPLRVQCTQTP